MTSVKSPERVSDLLFRMRRKGVRIWVDDGNLRYQTSTQSLTAEDLEHLRSMRQDILTFLGRPAPTLRESRPIRRQPSERIPLSFPQQPLWDHLGLEHHPSIRSVASALRLRGRLDTGCLRQSLTSLIHRHEALRTRLIIRDGVPEQHVDPPGEYSLEILDLTSAARHEREIEARRLIEQVVHEPFFVGTGPLLSVLLLKLDSLDHVLLIATDHAISDIASLGIIWRDLFTLYSQSVGGQPEPLPEIAVQYPDYAVWQRRTHPSWMENHHTYWTGRLAGARRVPVLPHEQMTQSADAKWKTLPVSFGERLTLDLLEISRRAHTSLVMTVFTAFAGLVLRWCNVSDVVLPFVTLGRSYPEVENTVGFFGTPIYLRVEILVEDTFLDLLGRATREYATASAHHDSWRMSVDLRRPEFMANPLFNWTPREFNRDANRSGQLSGVDNLAITPFEFDMTVRDDQDCDVEPRIDLSDSPKGVTGAIGYPADRITADNIARFARALLSFARKLAAEPESRVLAMSPQTCQ